MFAFIGKAFNRLRTVFFRRGTFRLRAYSTWGTVYYFMGGFSGILLSCALELAAYSECLLIGLKEWFLLKETLYKYVDILLPLAINCVADSVVRRWKGRKELLEHLILVKGIFYLRVNGFNMPSKALNVCSRVLNITVFRYSVYDELMEILAAYG
jgi:hypothetical protein